MALLGNDGRGYDLARRLESCGVWRAWLGDSNYAAFVHFLSSPSAWESFMRVDDSKSRAQIHLQLRARALLFDKATVALFLRSNSSNPSNSSSSSSSSITSSKLNPNYLHLHGDDVYFTLEGSFQDGAAASTNASKPKSSFSAGSRYGETDFDSLSQRYRNEELLETWYNQFIEKYRLTRPYKLSFGDGESEKRTPEEMTTYLRVLEKHKRRRVAFQEDQYVMYGNSGPGSNSVLDGNNSADDNIPFFPEIMFIMNCVPDSALPPTTRVREKKTSEIYGVLDTLPQISTRSPVMIERLGIRPEYLNIEQAANINRGKNNRKQLGQEQASHISRKVIAQLLIGVGVEGATEAPVEVFSQFLSCHICKLGRNLKVLTDNYRKQCSAIELIRMFLQTSGYSNFGTLAELVKDGTRNLMQQTQQPMHGIPSQLHPHQNALRMAQQLQMPRQMHPQMQQMVHPQNLAFQQQQQQLERMRRRHLSTARPVINMDKDRLVQVKIEKPSELPMDSNAFNPINARHQQMQFHQHPIAEISNLHAQPGNQFRQLMSPQIHQMQTPNMGMARAPPVKVEGFQELMGGDTTLKHDSDETKLTSPQNK